MSNLYKGLIEPSEVPTSRISDKDLIPDDGGG